MEIIWERWSTKVIVRDNGDIEVSTPINIESNFKTKEGAILFAESWGMEDERTISKGKRVYCRADPSLYGTVSSANSWLKVCKVAWDENPSAPVSANFDDLVEMV